MSASGRAFSAILLACSCAAPAAAQERFSIQPLPKSDKELAERFTPAQIEIVEKLNRRDREHLIRVDPPVPGIVVPNTWEYGELAYSPMPLEWPAAIEHSKYLVVHQPMQVFAAYEFGTLVRWGPVSSGRKETPTPSGAFNLTWR